MASTAITFFIFFVTLTGAGCMALEWERAPAPVVYTCKGSGVVVEFPWQLSTLVGVEDIHWFFNDSQTPRLLATYAHGEFLLAEEYEERVTPLGNAGVTLSDVTESDAGRYRTEVIVRAADGSLLTYTQVVYLQVADGPMVDEGKLAVTQEPTALWNAASGQWFIRLLCGHFTFLGAPPMTVEWTLPSGTTLESSGYENGRFLLDLSLELLEGNYTCTIPSQFYSTVCTTGSPGTKAALYMDEVRAKLTLVEAENRRLDQQQEQMMVEKELMHAQITNLTDKLQEMREEMQNTNQSLSTEIQELRSEIAGMIECGNSKYTVMDDPSGIRDVNNTGWWYQCDSGLATQWYRLYINGQDAVLPTTCPPMYRCGTYGPGWLDLQGRELPTTTGQTLDALACVHYNEECCALSKPIVVKNCGSFFLYKLESLDQCYSYSSAYCFQRKE